MKCPFCSHLEDKVIDSRLSQDGDVTRRRRECLGCAKRYTTYERVEETLPFVVKKDGTREVFDRMKILSGLKKAFEKRPVSTEAIDGIVDRIEKKFVEAGQKEVPSTAVGEAVMSEIKALDEVAYVRFASVYREFRDISEFMKEMMQLIENKDKQRRGEK
ncbi:MAG: transcriptional regulator NrdR [Deltaproteobacteria bacterium]|nr:transcriptional regulator NrdR [Deltaproteobacteria bacterium]